MTTTTLPSIHERMVSILAALPPIGKDQKNQQQGFMFRGHDDVLNALNPLLAKHGVFVVPDVTERITAQRTTAKGSVLFEVNLHVRFTFFGAAGDYVVASAWGEGTDSGDKSTNKAMTMAFKNVLNQAFAISNKEVADADAETAPESVPRPSEPSPERKQLLDDVVAGIERLKDEPGWSLKDTVAAAERSFGRSIVSLEDLTDDELGKIARSMPR